MLQQRDMTGDCSRSVEGGLWGCIVVASAFLIQVLAFGTSESIGIYNIEFLRYFNAGNAEVSLVGSLNLGIFLGAGPMTSILLSRYSHRQVALLGACLSNVGLIFMPFAPSLPYMYVFYGVITGLGYSLVYVPSHVLSGLYFNKHRSLATGIATAGSGFGASVFPIVMYHVIEYYGWRGSLYIISGLNLHLFIFAALLRPVPIDLLKSFKNAEEKLKLTSNGDSNNANDERFEKQNPDVNELNENGTGVVVHSNDSVELDCAAFMISKKQNLTFFQKFKSKFRSVLNGDFIVFWLSNICWNAGGAVMLLFFPEYAHTVGGLDKEEASIAYTMAGVGTCIGCVLGGLLGNIKYFNRLGVYVLGNIGAGITMLMLPWRLLHTFSGLLTICLFFGLMFGIILGLLVVVTSDLLGTEALASGFGFLMLANGMGVLGGPPLAGLLIDMFKDQDLAMYFAGIFNILGGVLICVLPIRKAFCGTEKIRQEITVH